jgi:hypothetical protein
VVAELFAKGKLVPVLVSNLQKLMSRARALQLAAAGSPLPDQGCYSYRQLVDQYMLTIQYLHEVHNASMAPELCVLLWEQLVEQPVTLQDKAAGLRFFVSGISRHNEQFISPATAGQLLRERIMRLDPAGLQLDAWHCFFEYFRRGGACRGGAGGAGGGWQPADACLRGGACLPGAPRSNAWLPAAGASRCRPRCWRASALTRPAACPCTTTPAGRSTWRSISWC